MRAITLTLLALVAMSCQRSNPEPETTIESTSERGTNTSEMKSEQCYMYVVGKDSIRLQLNRQGNRVSGRITFDNFEKDSSKGSVSGQKVGDTLKLVYDFESEGMQSKREMYFLETGGELRMGLGQFEPRDGVDVHLGPLDYRGPISLKPVDCTTDF